MRASNAPKALWDCCIERRALIHNVLLRPLFQNCGQTPFEETFGEQGDISTICTFKWYQWVYYRNPGSFPNAKEYLGRVLGPVKNEGSEMSQYVVTFRGTAVPRRSLRPLKVADIHYETEKWKRAIFDDIILKKLGDPIFTPPSLPVQDFVPYSDGELDPPLILDEDPVTPTGKAMFEKPLTDMIINAELSLPQGELMQPAKVIGRYKDAHGKIVGTYDTNPLMNTLVYDVKFTDGDVREFSANIICENMYSQVDNEGFHHDILDSVVDCRKNSDAISNDNKYITTKSGQRRLRKSTVGWDMKLSWTNGSESWVPLSLIKNSNPIETSEFAVAWNLASEPAFAWWVPYTLRKRDTVISAVKDRVKRVSHKYGVELPKSVKEALEIDARNGNNVW